MTKLRARVFGYNWLDTADTWENRERARNATERHEREIELRRFPHLREPKADTTAERVFNRTFNRR